MPCADSQMNPISPVKIHAKALKNPSVELERSQKGQSYAAANEEDLGRLRKGNATSSSVHNPMEPKRRATSAAG